MLSKIPSKTLLILLALTVSALLWQRWYSGLQIEILETSRDNEKLKAEQLSQSLKKTREELKEKIASLESIQKIEDQRTEEAREAEQKYEEVRHELQRIRQQPAGAKPRPEITYHDCLAVPRPKSVTGMLKQSTHRF